MENFDEIPFSRVFGTEREDIPLVESRFTNSNQIELINNKREEVKKIGLDWIIYNYIPLGEFNTDLLHINRIPARTPGDLWRFQLLYGENHLPPIIKLEVEEALLFTKKSGINRIGILKENIPLRFKEIIEEIDSTGFIRKILQNEDFYDPTKYKISNLKKGKDGEIESIMVNIEESSTTTLTPFVRLEDFDRVDSPLVHRNPRSKEDLGIFGSCRVKLLLHFSHLQVTNSQYILTIYVKKCGFE